MRTAAGPAHRPSFISRVSFSFPQLTAWKFETNCVFSPYDLPYCLLSLNDFVPHLVIRSNKETPDYPEGSVVFQLRTDHGGKTDDGGMIQAESPRIQHVHHFAEDLVCEHGCRDEVAAAASRQFGGG